MRRLALLAAVSSALASPAFAQDTGFYVGGELGSVFPNETDLVFTPAATAATTGTVTMDQKLGLSGSLFAGYDFGVFRIEAELGQMLSDVQKLDSDFTLERAFNPGSIVVNAGSQDARGEVDVKVEMFNALLDVGGFSDFTFFIGGGIGRATLEVKQMWASGGAAVLLDGEYNRGKAWQGIAGFRKPLTSNIDLSVRYRYLKLDDDYWMFGHSGRIVDFDSFTAHTLAAGVNYRF